MRKIGPFVIGLASSSDSVSGRLNRMVSLRGEIEKLMGVYDPSNIKRVNAINERIEEYRLLRERVLPLAELEGDPGFAMWMAECERRRDEARERMAMRVARREPEAELDAIEVIVIESLCLGITQQARDEAEYRAKQVQDQINALHASNQRERK